MQEFCNGGSLRQAISRGMFGKRLRWRWQPIVASLQGIASGMDYMHAKRICHGDLNPNNVLLKVRSLSACACAVLPSRLACVTSTASKPVVTCR